LYTSCVLGLRPSALFYDIFAHLSKKKKNVNYISNLWWVLQCLCTIEYVEFLYCNNLPLFSFLFLQRNNLPAVRQYLETFAINIYLKFPSLVRIVLLNLQGKYSQLFLWFSFDSERFLLGKLTHTPNRIRSHTLSLTTSCLKGWKCLLDCSPLASFDLEY
jgi:hypothetical protein